MRAAMAKARQSRKIGNTSAQVPTGVTNLTRPSLGPTVEVNVQRAVTEGTWSGSIAGNKEWQFYSGASSSAATDAYRLPPNTIALYTPELSRLGLYVRVCERVFDPTTGVIIGEAYSDTVLVAAAPGELVTAVAISAKTLTEDEAFAGFTPVVASGGTTPYTYSTTFALANYGLQINASTGEITATGGGAGPTLDLASTSVPIKATDALSEESTSNFTLIINPAVPAQALARVPYPLTSLRGGSAGSYSGTALVDIDGDVLIGPASDPGGSAATNINIHRIKQTTNGSATGLNYGGVRAELHDSASRFPLLAAHDYWIPFAFWIKSDEKPVTGSGSDDTFLTWQTHTSLQGSTQPDIALFMYGTGTGRTYFRRSWGSAAPSGNQAPTYASNGNKQYEGLSTPWLETGLPAAGTWHRFIMHYRPGYQAAHNPRWRVWRSIGGAAYTQLFDDTGLNTYNNGGVDSQATYVRCGPYKWTYNNWSAARHAFYITPLTVAEGTDLYDNCVQNLVLLTA